MLHHNVGHLFFGKFFLQAPAHHDMRTVVVVHQEAVFNHPDDELVVNPGDVLLFTFGGGWGNACAI